VSGPDRSTGPIVFFDGDCGLCNRTVRFLLDHDRRGRLRFAPLQGHTAAERLTLRPGAPLDTLYLVDHQGTHDRSTAALRVAGHLGGAWRVLRLLLLVPRPLRDGVYRLVARYRHRPVGKEGVCRLGGQDERARMLP